MFDSSLRSKNCCAYSLAISAQSGHRKSDNNEYTDDETFRRLTVATDAHESTSEFLSIVDEL